MTVNLDYPQPKQIEFLTSKEKHIAYGGARGGGKSWAVRYKATLLGITYPGIKMLIVRKTYQEVINNHVTDLRDMLRDVAKYNKTDKTFVFVNGSIIRLGYCNSDEDASQYQGQEYDVIFFDEATQLSEKQLKMIVACCRGVNNFPKHIYYTCNPGGQGHTYIKRLFIDRLFNENEDEKEYKFIRAAVKDNQALMQADADYIKQLQALPPKLRKAWLDGDWDIFEGQFFEDFIDKPQLYQSRHFTNVIEPFEIPSSWTIYRSYDHGYAKPFSVGYWAVDYEGRAYRIIDMYGCTDSADEGVKWEVNKIFSEMKKLENTHRWLKGKQIIGVADPAIWQKTTGESIADTAAKYGIYFNKGDNNRLAGWMQFHYRLAFDENGIPMCYIFNTCRSFIRTIPTLQYSQTKPEDLDTKQEDHIADESRYFFMANPIQPRIIKKTYAANGAVYYAQNMIASKKYDEVIAIGIAGDYKENIKISVYYVFSPSLAPKEMPKYTTLDFVQSSDSFKAFYDDATVTETEKYKILIKSKQDIVKHAKQLNKLMNNHNIGVDQRVVYVSGMLLAMQDIVNEDGDILDGGLVPDDLKGIQTEQKRDGVIIVKHLEEYLDQKNIAADKKKIMLDSFRMSISLDAARDVNTEIDKIVGKLLDKNSSITKQVFVYLYENVFKVIDLSNGALDIMAEMYSTFLKYALSDGAPLGKVLTPPYITSVMARILDINMNSKVMDLATGSAAFLVAAMGLMVDDANRTYGKGTEKAKNKIQEIKHQQLLGVEVDAKMYTLAATNMILRGDGSTQIKKADTFKMPISLYDEFKADRLLLNPPFSYTEYGMPFFEFGLDHMEKGGRGAVIIQDSAGAGKAILTNQNILKKHKMIASIKMPADLFNPNAIVQTSIYVFEAGTPHNYDCDVVKFIDFRNDGYKRTERLISDVDHPAERYQDLYYIYKMGLNAVSNSKFHPELWNLNEVYCEDTIDSSGKDWNYEQHKKLNTVPKDTEYGSTICSHLAWEIGEISDMLGAELSLLIKPPVKTKEFPVKKYFEIEKTSSYNKEALTEPTSEIYDYVTRTAGNRGICERTGFINERGLNEAGVFSLGLLQMTFFYRERQWYAGQFVRKVKCKLPINKFSGIYLETVLSGLSKKLQSGLVRDVDETFLDSNIVLPVNDAGEPDFQFMEKYVKENRKEAFSKYKEWFSAE